VLGGLSWIAIAWLLRRLPDILRLRNSRKALLG
jgi:hypothetical protein